MQNSIISKVLTRSFSIVTFSAIIFLLGVGFSHAQEDIRVSECANVVESSSDCLLDISTQFVPPVGDEVPAFLIENLHRHNRIFDHTLVLISNFYQGLKDLGGVSKDKEKRLFSTIASTCNLETYTLLTGHIRQLERDDSLFPVYYVANLPSCENMTKDDLEDLRGLLEQSGMEAVGLVYLNRHYVALGEIDGAKELAYRLFDLHGDSMVDAPGVQFGPTAGDVIVLVIGALLSNERVDEALELARFHIQKDWHWSFFQRLIDLRVEPQNAESFLEFANRLDVPAIANEARSAAVMAYVKLGDMDKALNLLDELESAPVAEFGVRKALSRGGYDPAIYAKAHEIGIVLPTTFGKLGRHSRAVIRDLAEAHEWSELDRFIEAQLSDTTKLEAKQEAGKWIIRNGKVGGADVMLAERAIEYFRASYSLVSEKGGHKTRFARNAKWNENNEAAQVLKMAEQSGLFEPDALKTNQAWSQLFKAYTRNEVKAFGLLINDLKKLREGLVYVAIGFCSNIGTHQQAEMCLHALNEKWRQGKSGVYDCQYLTEVLKFGYLRNATLSLGDIKNDATKASCALHLWIALN